MDRAKQDCRLCLKPFISGKTPEVVIELTDAMTGTSMLDAGKARRVEEHQRGRK